MKDIKSIVLKNVLKLTNSLIKGAKCFYIERIGVSIGRKYKTGRIWCYKQEEFSITISSVSNLKLKELIIIYIELKKN